ncbi:hypothetical protein C1645_787313 [Glomus cerebriforme]|uniref:Phosphatidylglycerol/phosphatidylinositol transfer protein n=1 Tax=Glomus cerebriforme TaxID=658196 RepID=A0A397SAG8_9GLOM|nr:hypothetical protein C1645_787313 [Glomus cerebriforme]
MKQHFIFVITLFTTILTTNAILQFKPCNDGYYPNPINNVIIMPDPPIFGQFVNLYINVTQNAPIEDGVKADLSIIYPNLGIPITFVIDICNSGLQCPNPDKIIPVTIKFFLASRDTPLTINFTFRIVNPGDNILTCVTGYVDIQ